MIVRSEEKAIVVDCPHGDFISKRYLTKKDGMGFALNRTLLKKGDKLPWHYANHLEACLCVSGSGVLINLEANETHHISPGTMYALNNNEKHRLTVLQDMELVCVFNPPLKGNEIHNENGVYDV